MPENSKNPEIPSNFSGRILATSDIVQGQITIERVGTEESLGIIAGRPAAANWHLPQDAAVLCGIPGDKGIIIAGIFDGVTLNIQKNLTLNQTE
ncbi:MAG TPA: hypothetical protein VGA67_03070 [Candidatus Dojkabacteria bacterium]|jgi:hypothetical protein